MANTKKTDNSVKKNTTKKNTTKNNVKPKTTKIEKTEKVEKVVKKVEEKPLVKEEKITKIPSKQVTKEKTLKENLKENAVLIALCVICILLIINIIIIVLGHRVKLTDGKEILASVDGKDITADEVYENIKGVYGTNALVTLIDEYIVSQEISDDSSYKTEAEEQVSSIKSQYESAGYEWETILSNYGYANEDALLSEVKLSLMQEQIAKDYLKEDISDSEIQKYYDENIYGDYTVKHILIAPDTTDDMTDEEKEAANETAKNTATEIINKLNNGEDWATLVSEYSDDEGSVDDEGLIENFTKGDVEDDFFEATLKLEDGKYTTEPVKTTYGYHVILKISNTEKDSLDKVKDEILETLVENKLEEDDNLYTETWANIRKTYNLTINDTVIENKYNELIKGE